MESVEAFLSSAAFKLVTSAATSSNRAEMSLFPSLVGVVSVVVVVVVVMVAVVVVVAVTVVVVITGHPIP